MASIHIPVLLNETVQGLKLRAGLWYLDGTLGGAGHAEAIAGAVQGKINIIGLDRNSQAIEAARPDLTGKAEKLILEVESFRNLDTVMEKHGIEGVDRILLDLGLSSDELDASGRGFTFQRDEPLLMTMGDPDTYPFTAQTIVNDWEEEVIANIIFGYGEERFARRIARAIIAYRDKKKIETTHELAEIIKSSVPGFYRRGKIHPATRTFQALRIAVNEELNALKEGLEKGYEKLNAGGIMAVISFHSLEDRIVKQFYKDKSSVDNASVSKKPLRATQEEILNNPRSRSARLRILEKKK
jgi:16S rRNA (cytosine1402-N4)-methyltransferase